MWMTGSPQIDAEQAFTRASRARRRAAITARFRRGEERCRGLQVFEPQRLAAAGAVPGRGVREIPLDAISGSLEPSRASLFDRCFYPASAARSRWQRLWLAEHHGDVLPPISVVPVGTTYAVRDGHHRVSVARARGAVTIDATVDPAF